ncbi:mycothiol synthase, partial [Streptomyces sp. MK37H]|nr:mycothiol synthase [Streptomyces sp. MK37H]
MNDVVNETSGARRLDVLEELTSAEVEDVLRLIA